MSNEFGKTSDQPVGGAGTTQRRRTRFWRGLGLLLGAFALLAAVGITILLFKIRGYVDPYHAKVAAAGYVPRTVQVNQVGLRYVEGPDNGPPLVLLHAQHLDWFSYSRVMPELARSFHVYVVDYPGHGRTTTPPDYPMTADRIGADLGDFIQRQIGEPVFISGNSSGGLLAVWLAAHRPALIKAALLEDPPLFSSEYPRIQQTVADRSFATSDKAVRAHARDFLLYWIQESAPFFEKNVGPGTPFLLTQAIQAYRRAHPGQPVEIGLLRNDTVRMLLRGLDQYDPRFGAAFHDGSWNRGFDHAAALEQIRCPTLLLQADTATLPDGTLNGAMSPEEAARAAALLKQGQYLKIEATHVVNLAQPQPFTRILESFFLGKAAREPGAAH